MGGTQFLVKTLDWSAESSIFALTWNNVAETKEVFSVGRKTTNYYDFCADRCGGLSTFIRKILIGIET